MKERNTVQKMKIKEYLKASHHHPSAEAIYQEMRKELPTITRGTIYRNLNQMAEQGEIIRYTIGDEYRFDSEVSIHQHCVCTSCSGVMDNFQGEISKSALQKFHSTQFKAVKVNIFFEGLCTECQEKNSKKTTRKTRSKEKSIMKRFKKVKQ